MHQHWYRRIYVLYDVRNCYRTVSFNLCASHEDTSSVYVGVRFVSESGLIRISDLTVKNEQLGNTTRVTVKWSGLRAVLHARTLSSVFDVFTTRPRPGDLGHWNRFPSRVRARSKFTTNHKSTLLKTSYIREVFRQLTTDANSAFTIHIHARARCDNF